MKPIYILDFGSQFTQLITRRVRELGFYSEVISHKTTAVDLRLLNPGALILSGGPSSVFGENVPKCDPGIFDLRIPVLGICYGMQLMTLMLGGEVEKSNVSEYGRNSIKIENPYTNMFSDMSDSFNVWMSHGDHVLKAPPEFEVDAKSDNGIITSFADRKRKLYGLQFHPEVHHTENGMKILENFITKECSLKSNWSMDSHVKRLSDKILEKVGKGHVICALSGGVDSSVAAVLIHKILGDRLHCFFVDHGLLRSGDVKAIDDLKALGLQVDVVDAKDKFLTALRGIIDPEKKRKIIGREFIRCFEKECDVLSERYGEIKFLVQGTLYPDVIESMSAFDEKVSSKIKSHHNVGGLPTDMKLELLEPFRELFKDEVREIGREINVPEEIIARHPFPGPGLAIRIIGDITEDKLNTLRHADQIFVDELKSNGIYDEIWQALAILTSVQTVGVKGDGRAYDSCLALRAVTSRDGMTADWYRFDHDILAKISNRISNEVPGIGRVVYDISSKPPATIEWE